MEIQSAFNSGVQGFQKATEGANQAAANIAAETTINRDENVTSQAVSSQTVISKEQKIPDLNQSIVDLKVAEFQAKSSTQVIKTADEALGTLVDVTA